MTNASRLHPLQYSDGELRGLLRLERTKATHQLTLAKRQLRELAAEVERLETRLTNIDNSEESLSM
jgi:hypothetical protein